MPTRMPGSASTSGRLAAALAVTVAVAALAACARASGAPGVPAIADYEVTLHHKRTLALDPDIAKNGRFELVAGDGLVLELHASRGKTKARDGTSDWAILIQLPAATGALELRADTATAVARVASEDVTYLARKATGRVSLARTTAPVTGTLDVTFATPDRDHLKLGALRVAGAFKAALR